MIPPPAGLRRPTACDTSTAKRSLSPFDGICISDRPMANQQVVRMIPPPAPHGGSRQFSRSRRDERAQDGWERVWCSWSYHLSQPSKTALRSAQGPLGQRQVVGPAQVVG